MDVVDFVLPLLCLVKRHLKCLLLFLFSPNSPKPPISDDTDGISKHRLMPIMPTVKHYNTQKYRFPVLVLLKYSL